MQFINSSLGKTYQITDGKTVLTEDMLQALKWAAQNGFEVPKLSPSQQKQFITYGMAEAEKYSNTHSMRYSIMRDICKSIFGIKD
jgi:hypothetical protein